MDPLTAMSIILGLGVLAVVGVLAVAILGVLFAMSDPIDDSAERKEKGPYER